MTKGTHILETGASSMKVYKDAGWKPKRGFQLRYIYFIDPTARERLTVPILPFCTTAILPTMEQHQVIAAAVATLQKRENDAAMTSGRALELICADYIAGA